MESQDLRQLSVEELKGRVRQWRDELFRSRFKAQTSEAKDTSVFKKLRKDIARGLTILSQKVQSGDTSAPTAAKTVAASVVSDAPKAGMEVQAAATTKPVKKKNAKATKSASPKKSAKKKKE